jgi:hypothetical protein
MLYLLLMFRQVIRKILYERLALSQDLLKRDLKLTTSET